MESFVDKLPTATKRSLERWYAASCTALLLVVVSMTAIHLWSVKTLHSLHANATNLPTPLPLNSSAPEDALMQKRLDELDELYANKRAFLPFLENCLNTLPHEMQLTSCTFTFPQEFSCQGITDEKKLLADYVHELHKLGLTCTQVNINPHADNKRYDFEIDAKHCIASPF